MQTFTARKDRVEMQFAKRKRWRLVSGDKRKAIVQIVAAAVGQCDTIEEATLQSREAIRKNVGLDPIVMWLIGQVLSAVIKALWEWAHSDE